MNTLQYIREITNNVLLLVDDSPSKTTALGSGEYFCLIFFTEYKSYLHNYSQYKGKSNYNEDADCYDIDIWKQGSNNGYYLSTNYDKIKDDSKGRVIIVTPTDITQCVVLEDTNTTLANTGNYIIN
jgi:hypothetical protein